MSRLKYLLRSCCKSFKSLLGSVILLSGFTAQGQQFVGRDTIESIKYLPDSVVKLKSDWKSCIAPAAFISYGGLSFFVHPIRQLDYKIYEERNEHFNASRTTIDNYLQFAPIAAVYTLNLSGLKGKNGFVDRTLLLVLSEALFYSSTAFLKSGTHRLRPDGSNSLSWPSGHTGSAFVSAEFFAQEYSGRSAWFGVGSYSVAVTVAMMRIYNDKHWFSDTVAGAGFGIVATKVAYLIYPSLRKLIFRTEDQNRSSSILVPSYRDGHLGFMFAATF